MVVSTFLREKFIPNKNIVDYDMNRNTINGTFYSPDEIGSMELKMTLLIDRTSVEVYIDDGAYSYVMERIPHNSSGFNFWGNNIMVKELEVSTLRSIWE